jgi:hypothetical protein
MRIKKPPLRGSGFFLAVRLPRFVMRQDVFLRLAVQNVNIVISQVDNPGPQAAVSTTTGAGQVFAQLAINIVIRHMVNSLLYIAGLFRCFYPAFGYCFSGCGLSSVRCWSAFASALLVPRE